MKMKLNYKTTILTGLAFLSICSFWQIYDNIVPLILTNTFHIGETVTGFIMAADNVLALLLLPVFGVLSDRTHTKLGKRIPFIIIGTILSCTFMMMMPLADQKGDFIMFLVMTGLVLLAMGFYRSPAVALMPDVTPRPLRSRGNAVINLMGTIGAIYALVMIKLLVGKGRQPDYTPLFWSIVVFMAISVLILVVTVRENKLAERARQEEEKFGVSEEENDDTSNSKKTETSDKRTTAKLPADKKRSLIFLLLSVCFWYMAYNAVTTAFSRYATNVWGMESGGYADCLMISTIAAIISYIPIGYLSSAIGRKRTVVYGVIGLAFGFFYVGLFTEYSVMINVGFVLIGIFWAAINVNSFPMVVEIASDADVGRYTGYYYTFSMAAQVLTPILSGALLEYVSYRMLFPYAVLFSAMAIVTMLFVKHGDVKPIKKKSVLERFDVDD